MTSGTVSIDREITSQYQLTVLACQHLASAAAADDDDDDDECAANITRSLSIKVLDVNDNWPVFTTRHPSVTLVSDARRGSRIIQLSATDSDAPATLNSLVSYRLQSASQLFSVDALTGWVTLTESLIDVEEAELTLWVVAEDHGSLVQHASTTDIHIKVLSHQRRPRITEPPNNDTILVTQVHTHRYTHTHTADDASHVTDCCVCELVSRTTDSCLWWFSCVHVSHKIYK